MKSLARFNPLYIALCTLAFGSTTALVPASVTHAAYISTKQDFPEARIFQVKATPTGKATGASVNDAIGFADIQKLIDAATTPIRFHLQPGTYTLPASLDLRSSKAPLVVFEGVGQRTRINTPANTPLFLASSSAKLVLRHFRIQPGAILVTPLSPLVTVMDASVEPGAKPPLPAPILTGLPVPATARTVFISPDGFGQRLGHEAANAMSLADFQRNETNPQVATRYHFLPGNYPLKSAIAFKSTSTAQVVLEGEGDSTLFTGTFAFPEVNSLGAFLALNRSNVMVRNLSVRNVGSLVRVAGGARADDFLLDDVTLTDTHQGIAISRGAKFASVANWHINDLRIKGFYEAGMRIAGPTTKNIKITKTVLDGKNSAGINDCWSGGMQILESASFITVEDTKVANVIGTCKAGSYAQGDGIESDGKQGQPHDITLRRLTIDNVRDGALDLKSENTLIEDLKVVAGGPNRFPLRLWNSTKFKCVRCDIPSGASGHVNLTRAAVEIIDMVQDPATFRSVCATTWSSTPTPEGFKIFKGTEQVKAGYCKL